MRLPDAVVEFLLDRKARCSAKTVDWYTYFLDQFASHFRDPELSMISESDLNQFIVHQRQRERADLRNGKLTNSTIAGQVRAVKALFNFATERGWLEINPSARLKPPRSTSAPRYLSVEQVGQIVSLLTSGTWKQITRDRALILFLLDTGCRASEVVRLKCTDLNLGEGTARVNGKGDKVRLVGMTPQTIHAIQDSLGERQVGNVFLAETGTPLTRDGLRQILRRISRRIGIHLHPHLFRHTFGTLSVVNGMDLSHLQTLMGHSQVSTTQTYARAARVTAALRAHRRYSPIVR